VALRVAAPERIRAVAITSAVAGIALLEGSAAHGWLAWVGSGLFSVGVALFDGLSEGRVGPRQAGMVLLLLGLAGTGWAGLVIFLTVAFLESPISHLLYAALTLSLVAVAGGFALRRGGGRWGSLAFARTRAHGVVPARGRAA
jgi:hypothetical protein